MPDIVPTVAPDPTKAIVLRKALFRLRRAGIAFTGADTGDLLTAANHGLVNGRKVRLEVTTGLTGLTTGTDYFVVGAASGTLQLSATLGGAPVAISADGTGIIYPIIELWGKAASLERNLEDVRREVPDSDGFLVPDLIVGIRRAVAFIFESEEPVAVADVFAEQSLVGEPTDGWAQAFFRGAKDPTGKIGLLSNEFRASWRADGSSTLNFGEVMKISLRIDALEKATLKPHQTVT